MKIQASVSNQHNQHTAMVSTNGNIHAVKILAKKEGFGSEINGGELLFLSLATCFCNDVYREAALWKIEVSRVEVSVDGEFGKAGEPVKNITYKTKVWAATEESRILALLKHTDSVAEIQNTLRRGMAVKLSEIITISTL